MLHRLRTLLLGWLMPPDTAEYRRKAATTEADIELMKREAALISGALPTDERVREVARLRADAAAALSDGADHMNVVLTMPDRLTQYEKELKASLAESSGNPYVLSGYATQVAYDSREPTWGPDDDFAAVSSAEQAARAWLASQGAEAQVELIHLEGDEGRVVAVVSQSGIEQIDYGPSTGSS